MRVFTRNLTKLTNQIFLHPSNKVTFTKSENGLLLGKFTGSPSKENFQPDNNLLPTLNELFKKKVCDDFSFIMEAGVSANSFMPIYDFRDVPRYGRQPEIGNVFGYVQVDENGKMIPETFDANNFYQVYNHHGLPVLSDYIYEEVEKLQQ
ncbi:hypothetical protein CLIB1444_15S00364 [[Candida] jaroonii]|uniref:Uncharacterized protein n=1 Tax=[Candida] jaroonii TaxID=467808 RepID=A0ACA9YE79_9ASCO|nr:hypothetical protein CLIB1444_15S00364 [[Candida] jaroonii]